MVGVVGVVWVLLGGVVGVGGRYGELCGGLIFMGVVVESGWIVGTGVI